MSQTKVLRIRRENDVVTKHIKLNDKLNDIAKRRKK